MDYVVSNLKRNVLLLDNESSLKENCKTIDRLNAYLRQKGQNHNNYKMYSKFNRIIDIRNSKKLYLSNGEEWNDESDKKNFNSNKSVVNFGKCFSFSKSESVAMWMLYGGIHNTGALIDFTKKGMQSILNTNSVKVGCFENKEFKSVELKKREFEIYLTDVLYYTKNGTKYCVSRSDENCFELSKKVFNELNVAKKSYGWKYENECRLIVSIKQERVDKISKEVDCKFVQINLENIDLGKSFERIYRGPNNLLPEAKNLLSSELEGTIKWSLCDNETCPYKN